MALGTTAAIGLALAGGGLVGGLAKQGSQSNEARKAQEQADWYRVEGKKGALNALGGLAYPEMTELSKKRLAALEQESQAGPLSQDPLFQGDRARLLQGGAQELSAIQNTQRATGARGGFKNIGSLQDVEDRLGVAMSDLGQRSRQVKEQKRDLAAEAEQSFRDRTLDFINARQRAIAAIESGDMQTALANLQQASAARQQINQQQQQMFGQLAGIGGAIAGGAMSPAAASAPMAASQMQQLPATRYYNSSRYGLS